MFDKTKAILIRERLLDAESALHRLMLGELEVTVSVGGYGATTYNQVSADKLRAYIADLKQDLARAEGKPRRRILYTKF